MYIKPFTIEQLTLRDDWHYLRYGHGAQLAIICVDRDNCDGHHMGFPHMSDDLFESISKPAEGENVLYGLMPIGRYVHPYEAKITEFFSDSPVEEWVDGDPFYPAIVEKRAYTYTDFLRERYGDRILVVGPPHMRVLPEVLGIPLHQDLHLITSKNCYRQKWDMLKRIQRLRDEDRFDIVLFAAAMLSEVLIYKLHSAEGFENIGLIDVGAFFDPICGVRSRGYSKALSDDFLRDSFRYPAAEDAASDHTA
jgi:hypothetical protein